MKYRQLISCALACIFSLTALNGQTVQPPATSIRLQPDGLPDTAWVYLQAIHQNVKFKLDSTRLNKRQEIEFAYAAALEPGYYNLLLPGETALPVLLNDDQRVVLSTALDQPVGYMVVEGSLENDLLYGSLQFDLRLGERFQAEIQAMQETGGQPLDQEFIDQLRARYFLERESYYAGVQARYPNSLFAKYEKARQTPEILDKIMTVSLLDREKQQQLLLSHYWDNVDFSDTRLINTPVIYDKLWQYFNEFVPDQTAIKLQAADILLEKVLAYPVYYRFFASWLTDDYRPPFSGQMDPDAFYVHMVDHYLTTERAFWADSLQRYAWQLRANDQRVSLAGMTGQNFTARDPEGREQALYDIDAPYIALFFYHADCEHCVEETPRLVKQYEALKAQGLEVVAVAMGTPDAEWKAFIEKNQMRWFNLTDENNRDIYKKYVVRATPEIYLLNPARTIIGKHLAAEDIPQVIQMDKIGALHEAASVISR